MALKKELTSFGDLSPKTLFTYLMNRFYGLLLIEESTLHLSLKEKMYLKQNNFKLLSVYPRTVYNCKIIGSLGF